MLLTADVYRNIGSGTPIAGRMQCRNPYQKEWKQQISCRLHYLSLCAVGFGSAEPKNGMLNNWKAWAQEDGMYWHEQNV